VTTYLARASLASIRRVHAIPELHWGLGAAVVAAGCAGIHVVFGLLLSALVASRFLQYTRGAQVSGCAELMQFARHLARVVYLILYGVLLLKLMSEATSLSWHGGLAWGFAPHFLANPEQAFIECGERFRLELLWGVIALCLIRLLAGYQLRAAASRVSADMPLRKSSPPQRPELEARS
jgi:hypothetical protein